MSGLRGKKDLNTELNLTPLVDLFSTIVCFLLIAAVWVQVNALEVKQSFGTEAVASKIQNYDLNISYISPTKMKAVFKKGRRAKTFRVKGRDFETTLANMNKNIKAWFVKNKNAIVQSTFIKPKFGVDYGQLVSTMDMLKQNNLNNIGILKIGSR
ncbi:MAG: biopolymer transporter ExbD [Bacteriovoracaceae bacterium]|jgi:biopolymer transport protein ExbD|nr:biopolymer transporter ExbD [Bacteriovoracaceae bacterium]